LVVVPRRQRHLKDRRKASPVKVTIDSGEPLQDALRVVGALYDVQIVVAPPGGRASATPRSTGTAGTAPVSRAPRGPRTTGKRSAAAKSSTPVSTLELRSWARQNGFTVSERGRVATQVIAAYRAAHTS
jgi:hypothetical protein